MAPIAAFGRLKAKHLSFLKYLLVHIYMARCKCLSRYRISYWQHNIAPRKINFHKLARYLEKARCIAY